MELYYKKQHIEGLGDLKRLTKGWVHGKSAASIGEFVFDHNGITSITEIVNKILMKITIGDTIKGFNKAEFEHETRFDNYGQGRMHDLALFGNTTDGKKVFVGIESKVNEEFDSRNIQSAYISGLLRRANGNNSNLPERVESLIKRNHFRQKTKSASLTKEDLNLKYQLLYSTVGTAAEDADICILLVLVFKTLIYSEEDGVKNYFDYLSFMNVLTSEKIVSDIDLRKVEVFTDGMLKHKKTIFTAYEYVEAKDWKG